MVEISIIVPVYNVEKYLNKCVDSIIKQTFTNWELILVDDGSTDNSGLLCDKFVKKDKRIRVIHKKNGGLSEARNYGIDMSKGNFLIFVDSDDYIDKNMCSILLKKLKENNADIVSCNFYKVFDNKILLNSMFVKGEKIFLKDEILREYFLNLFPDIFATWNKIYKKELFVNNEIRFPIGRLHEDIATTYKLYYYANKIVVINKPLYYYVQRKSSIMNNISNKNIIDSIKVLKDFKKFINRIDRKEYKSLLQITSIKMYISCCDWIICQNKINDISIKIALNDMRKEVLNICNNIKDNKYIDKKYFLKYILLKLNILINIKFWVNKIRRF